MNFRKANTNHTLKNWLNPYPAYKDTGIEWLGQIPAHWEVKASRREFKIRLGKMLQPSSNGPQDSEIPYFKAQHVQWEAVRTTGMPFMWANSFDEVQYGVLNGDLLVCEGGEVGRAGIVRNPPNRAIIQNALHRVRSLEKSDIRLLMYLLKHIASQGWFDILCNRATIAHFTSEKFGDLPIPFPPVPEQRAIADFLDRETARIDALVAKKERLIELLREKRAALISHAVTKGLPADASVQAGQALDPTVPMKDSGVEWLGEVPAHWEVKRLRSAIKFQRGHDLPSDDREEGDVPVVSSSGISAMHSKAVATAPGIVTGRCGTIGQFYLINQSYWPHNTALYSIDLHGNKPRFLRYMLIHMSPLFCLHSIKSAVPAVDRNDIHADYTTVPPLPEQRAIADFLDRETAKIDTLVANVRQVNERLKELRSALISAAVTGKIDVRDAPARAPDESGNSTADGSVMPGASGGMG